MNDTILHVHVGHRVFTYDLSVWNFQFGPHPVMKRDCLKVWSDVATTTRGRTTQPTERFHLLDQITTLSYERKP